MTCLAENPAVTSPRRMLNTSQRRALLAIRDYRHQYGLMAGVRIGPHIFGDAVIRALKTHGLIRGNTPNLNLTEAGRIAADRLKGKP
jgi:hypothetical protein